MDARAAELIAVLRQYPDDGNAYLALRDHYAQIGDHASIANLVEGWAGRQRDPAAASAAFAEAGDVVFHQLRDLARAHRLYLTAVERDPRSDGSLERLLQSAEALADPSQMLDALRRRVALQAERDDGQGLAESEYRIGQLYEHSFGRPDKAIAHYRKAFETDPGALAAIYAAREIYRSAGNHRAAAPLLEREAQAEADPARKLQLLRELGHLQLAELGNPDASVRALQGARAMAASDPSVAHELQAALLARAEQGGPSAPQDRDEAAELLVELARSAPPEHALSYSAAALDASPGNALAMDAFEDIARGQGRDDLLAARWVGFLHAAAPGPETERRRRDLGFAYLHAGQSSDALVCLEPLRGQGDRDVDEALITLFRELGRESDALQSTWELARSDQGPGGAERMREVLSGYRALGDETGARSVALELIERTQDAEALAYVDERLRAAGEYQELRQLLERVSRATGLAHGERLRYLESVAALCIDPLQDIPGAIDAYRAIASLDPSHARASSELTRLLRADGRLDELAAHLDALSLTLTDPEEKIEGLRVLAQLHLHEREDGAAAIQSLRSLLQLSPDDGPARALLTDALLSTDDGAREGAQLLARQAAAAQGEERAALFTRLAEVYEERLGDDAGAFTASRRVLDEVADDRAALDRMERIDRRAGDFERLAETLAYRAEMLDGSESTDALVQLGEVSRNELADLERAANAYSRALDSAPERRDVLDALCAVYEEGGRDEALVALLERRAERESAGARVELFRRIARIHTRSRAQGPAEAAWREVLEGGDDAEALEALVMGARVREAREEQVQLLARLAKVASDEAAVEALYERAECLVELGRREEAVGELESLLDARNPEHTASLALLLRLAENDDAKASALERRLRAGHEPVETARELADLYEGPLARPDAAIRALEAWLETDGSALEALRRLAPLLEGASRFEEAVGVLDRIAELASDEHERRDASCQAARFAASELGDAESAWLRLQPWIDDAGANEQLAQLAQASGQMERLATVYAQLASQGRERWRDAARAFESAAVHDKALESMLRAFAADLHSDEMLDEVDRLALKAQALPRLAQVYEKLLGARSEEAPSLLRRHAALLAEAGDTRGALRQTLRAGMLAPRTDAHLEEALRLAAQCGRSPDVLPLYEARKNAAENDEQRVEALLGGARICLDAGDEAGSQPLLAQAIALSLREPSLVESLHHAMADREPALVDLYARLGADADDDPRAGAELLKRAAQLMQSRSPSRALELFKEATDKAALPAVLDAFEAFAKATSPKVVLEHYASLVDDAIDPDAVAELSRRRGDILFELGDAAGAAESYRRVVSVRRDAEVVQRYIDALRTAGRHQDLLIVLDKEANRSESTEGRAASLRAIARVWQNDLQNRFEAKDAWNKVLREVPGDPEAEAAIASLGEKPHVDTSEVMLPEAGASLDPLPTFIENEATQVGDDAADDKDDAHFEMPDSEAPAAPLEAEPMQFQAMALADDEGTQEVALPEDPEAYPMPDSQAPEAPLDGETVQFASIAGFGDDETLPLDEPPPLADLASEEAPSEASSQTPRPSTPPPLPSLADAPAETGELEVEALEFDDDPDAPAEFASLSASDMTTGQLDVDELIVDDEPALHGLQDAATGQLDASDLWVEDEPAFHGLKDASTGQLDIDELIVDDEPAFHGLKDASTGQLDASDLLVDEGSSELVLDADELVEEESAPRVSVPPPLPES